MPLWNDRQGMAKLTRHMIGKVKVQMAGSYSNYNKLPFV